MGYMREKLKEVENQLSSLEYTLVKKGNEKSLQD